MPFWTTPRSWTAGELVSANLLNEQLRDNVLTVVPAGATIPFAGIANPPANWGWLLCDGSAVSRTTYARLFSAIGTTYGVGDGTNTFNLPDLRGRFPLGKDNMGGVSANRVVATQADNLGQGTGAETHTLTITEMPAHTHGYQNGAGTPQSREVPAFGINTGSGIGTTMIQSAGGGATHNNMPPYITLNFIIKY